MAFGFSPKHTEEYTLDDLNKEHFLVMAWEAASRLNWDVTFISENGFKAFTGLSWTSWSEEITVFTTNETAILKSESIGNQLYDWSKNKKNVEAFAEMIEEVKSELTATDLEQKLQELKEQYITDDEDILNQPPSTGKEKITNFFSIFKPVEGYYITPILLNLNLAIFVAMVLSGVHFFLPETESLVNWGANFKPVTLAGQWWRLLTCCFIHIGILHLLLNMYALLYIGLILEPYLGKTRFLAAYLLSGVAASMTSLWWHDLTVSAGASGAIFGMYGVFLAMLTTNLLDKSVKKALLTSIAVFISYNLMNGFKPNSGIDNAAHIGGLLSGLLIGYAFVPALKKHENTKLNYLTISGLTLILIVGCAFMFRVLPKDMLHYEERIQTFIDYEQRAMTVYSLPEGTPNEQLLSELKDSGIYYWNQNLKIVNSFEELDLPEPIKRRNTHLKTYCELRISSYEVIYKAVAENTDRYEKEIASYNRQIDKLVTELTKQ
jgi:rhomboid protease GluP